MMQENSNDNSVDEDVAALADMAVQHYQEGHLQKAQDVCQRILRKQQRPDAILILAKIAHEQRNFKVAAERYQQFLGIVPDHAQTHYNLGLVLNKLGRSERAIEHLKKSINNAAANTATHRQLGDAYTQLQRWEEAIKSYQQVLAVQAEDVGTVIKLGNVFIAAQQLTDSILLYEQALTVRPDNALLHRHLGASLHRMGQTQEALGCFEQALSLRPNYVGARIDLALVLRQLGKPEEALVQLEEATDLKPDDVDAHISLALTLRQLGQLDLAVQRLEQFLRTRPNCGPAYYHISLIKPEKKLIPVVEKLIKDRDLPNGDAVHCHFALGNFLDAGQSFDQAFGHFLKANALQRQTFTYDPRENTHVFEKLIKVYSRDFFQSKRHLGSASRLPVFILGMPRSGTTLVEQILSSHASVHGAGEIEALPGVNRFIAQQLNYGNPPPECMSLIDEKIVEEYSARYLQELTLHCPAALRITDKLPGNFVRIGLIKTLFPDARIIHCQRNPLDNCISLFFHCFMALMCSFELTELGQYYLDYRRLMSHWQNLFRGEILTVQYEELVVDQERVSRQLIDYIGLEWDERCLEFHKNTRNVMSPSNMQVRQSMYKGSMNRWKRYEKHIQPLINVLQPAMDINEH
jgi:tetratricopeptide (TPR) repeat protein